MVRTSRGLGLLRRRLRGKPLDLFEVADAVGIKAASSCGYLGRLAGNLLPGGRPIFWP